MAASAFPPCAEAASCFSVGAMTDPDTIGRMKDDPDSSPPEDQPEAVRNDDRRAKHPDHLLLWTIEDVAAMCGISRSTAYRMRKDQSWPSHRFGTELRFAEADVEAIQAMNHQAPPTATAEPRRRTPRVGTRANRARS